MKAAIRQPSRYHPLSTRTSAPHVNTRERTSAPHVIAPNAIIPRQHARAQRARRKDLPATTNRPRAPRTLHPTHPPRDAAPRARPARTKSVANFVRSLLISLPSERLFHYARVSLLHVDLSTSLGRCPHSAQDDVGPVNTCSRASAPHRQHTRAQRVEGSTCIRDPPAGQTSPPSS